MAWYLLAAAVLFAAVPLILYPAALWLVAVLCPAPAAPVPKPGRATVVVAFTGGGPLMRTKVSTLAAAAAKSAWRVDLVLAGDGPIAEADAEAARAAAGDMPITLCALDAPAGKAHALNLGVGQATGEVLVFSDLDAKVEAPALEALLGWFADPTIGVVCGRRVIARADRTAVAAAGQSAYADLDSWIKLQENRLGAITSNDGKLYAVRRSLFQPIHAAATDDLYNALSVIQQGYRVLFEPAAVAWIPTPAWTVGHDLTRRRRVTLRSLTGLLARPAILATPRFGLFGPRLVINKLLRRLLPVWGLLATCALLLLAPAHAWAAGLLAAMLAGGLVVAAYAPLARRGLADRLPGKADKLWASAFYAGLGMLGMLLGLMDYLRGKRLARWVPRKTA